MSDERDFVADRDTAFATRVRRRTQLTRLGRLATSWTLRLVAASVVASMVWALREAMALAPEAAQGAATISLALLALILTALACTRH